MNQILFLPCKKSKKKLLLLVFQLILSLLTIFMLVLYLSNLLKNRNKNETFSRYLTQKVNINSLYSKNYQVVTLNEPVSIIGIIEINKINIKYPIFAYSSDELLKIGICRFYGPDVNSTGNLCLAGHNYNDHRFFSNLFKLEINDEIKIYDNSNNYTVYYIYSKYEIDSNNLDCINQNTLNKKDLTLVTCNNINNKRLVVKAKE